MLKSTITRTVAKVLLLGAAAVAIASVPSLVVPQSAHAATCFITKQVVGKNVYVYNDVAYGRHVATGTLCILHSQTSGYYIASAGTVCDLATARLVDKNITASHHINRCTLSGDSTSTSLYTETGASWKWYRLTGDKCGYTISNARWTVNRSNGTVSTSTGGQDAYFTSC